MANINHIGANVAAIVGLPWEDGGYNQKQDAFDKFSAQLKGLKYKYLLAITANKYQGKSRDILKQNGFKEGVTFYSNHNVKSETLTVWTKVQEGKFKLSKTKITLPGWNCSVTFNRDQNYRCNLTAQKDKTDIIPPGFNQIDKTPIYYKIANGEIVGLKLKKGAKDLGQLKPINLF